MRAIYSVCLALLVANIGVVSGIAGETGLVQSVRAKELLARLSGKNVQRKEVTTAGVRFLLLGNDGDRAGLIHIGVFESVPKASQVYERELSLTPMPPRPGGAMSSMIGEQTAEWEDRILFRRLNVIVDVRQFAGSQENELAEKIDTALRGSDPDVIKGASISPPRIQGVSFVNDRLRAQSAPAVSGDATVVDRFGQPSLDNSAVGICFATEGCVMAEPMKCDKALLSTKRKEAKAKEAEGKAASVEVQRQQVEEATATLREKGSSPYHRNKAVVALGNSGDMTVVSILLAELAEATDPIVKQNTIAALGRLRAKQAVPDLLKLLEAPVTGNVSDEGEWEAIYRRHAASALGSIGDSSALATLKKTMDATHEYQSVRDAARSALRKIEKPEGQ